MISLISLAYDIHFQYGISNKLLTNVTLKVKRLRLLKLLCRCTKTPLSSSIFLLSILYTNLGNVLNRSLLSNALSILTRK